MTVIAWDGVTLAADSSLNLAGVRLSCVKIEQFPDGSVFGAAGDGDDTLRLADFLRNGSKGRRPKCETVHALHIRTDGLVHLYALSARPEILTSPYAAIGTGNKFAMAIMWAGGDAAKACEAAIALDKSCSPPVQTLRPRSGPD